MPHKYLLLCSGKVSLEGIASYGTVCELGSCVCKGDYDEFLLGVYIQNECALLLVSVTISFSYYSTECAYNTILHLVHYQVVR